MIVTLGDPIVRVSVTCSGETDSIGNGSLFGDEVVTRASGPDRALRSDGICANRDDSVFDWDVEGNGGIPMGAGGNFCKDAPVLDWA